MPKVYYSLIKNNLWSIDRVPTQWREETQALLDADNA